MLAAITWLSLQHNNFTALPPALATATSLEGLDLSNCTALQLGPADVDALLAGKPQLRHLALAGSALPAAAEHLLQTAPQVKQVQFVKFWA